MSTVSKIAKKISEYGGKAYLVGGCVRDGLLGIEPKDFDLEVFGLDRSALKKCLKENFGETEEVGKCFGVFKIKKYPNIDIALPRTERKIGPKHSDFEITSDATLPIVLAVSRRDFTINSILIDPQNGQLIDPFGGIEDLKKRRLKHTSEKFTEDPLRVLRGMQFIARYCLKPSAATVNLCKTLTPEYLSNERITGEFEKLFTQGIKPSLGLKFLQKTQWLHWFPALQSLYEHTTSWGKYLRALDALTTQEHTNRYSLALVLTHYFCEQPETFFADKRFLPTQNKHRLFVERHTKKLSQFLRLINKNTSVKEWANFFYDFQKDTQILWILIDTLKQTTFPEKQNKKLDKILQQLQDLSLYPSVPPPLVTGKFLTGIGIIPHKKFSDILRKCYQIQINLCGSHGSQEKEC